VLTGPADEDGTWHLVPELIRTSAAALPEPWEGLFGPLRSGRVDDLVVVGQLGQSLDGRIATTSGDSHYINRPAGLAHLHRLRAVVDAVVVGVGTALADDPQLTVRRVAGPHPARVVLDPRGRLTSRARLLNDDGSRRIVVMECGNSCTLRDVEVVSVPARDGHMAPADIVAGLSKLGLRRLLIEGGADTISRFLAAGCLDRLHVVVAPIILGTGRAGIVLDPIDRVAQALRPPISVHVLDGEVLFDCDLSAQRALIGCAKTST
jgi:diaminohydroxyphosphoribosylaminopyrimidine deaminase / 5-amino-6-(5-phosphoribosylamino)uracil reductase